MTQNTTESLRETDEHFNFRPTVKYEIVISMHVLQDPWHHRYLTDWARNTSRRLPQELKNKIELLFTLVHEWQICQLLAECNAINDIDPILDYLRKSEPEQLLDISLLTQEKHPHPSSFRLADIVEQYWSLGFGAEYQKEYEPMLLRDIERRKTAIASLSHGMSVLEQTTGMTFKNSSPVLLCPSYFSWPHAYTIPYLRSQCDIIYPIQRNDFLLTISHELLHHLLSGWSNDNRLLQAIRPLCDNPRFARVWRQKGKGSYSYPLGWIEENIVVALTNFMGVRAGILELDTVEEQVATKSM